MSNTINQTKFLNLHSSFIELTRDLPEYRSYSNEKSYSINSDIKEIGNLLEKFEKIVTLIDDNLLNNINSDLDSLIKEIKLENDPDIVNNNFYYYVSKAKVKFRKYWEDILEIITSTFSDVTEAINNELKKASGISERLEFTLNQFNSKYKDVFDKGILLKQEEIFLKEGDKLKKQSNYLLYFAAGLSILLFILLFKFLSDCWVDLNCINTCDPIFQKDSKTLLYYELIRKSFIRITILSLLIYFIKIFIGLFKSYLHNATINLHKGNSFAAAIFLADKTGDSQGKNSVIEIAAKEIFTQQKTGYLNKDTIDNELNILSKLVELTKSH